MMTPEDAVWAWNHRMVVGQNLCPFAAPAIKREAVRVVASPATDLEGLVEALAAEIDQLLATATARLSTTLLVIPDMLFEFETYLDALEILEAVMSDSGLDGILQLASFHPNYQFADAEPDDPAHWTNRAPYPVFQLIRESEIEQAAAAYDVDGIPARNIERMRTLGQAQLRHVLSRDDQ